MSDGIDLDSLTPEQRSILQQYTAVTGQDIKDAIPLLQRTEWNVQIAITRFFDGEPTVDPLAEALAAAPPTDARRQETLMHGFETSVTNRSSRIRLEPAPRVVPQPDSQASRVLQPPLLLRLLFSPISLLYTIISRSIGLVGRLFPFLPRILSILTGTSPARPGRTVGADGPVRPRDSAAQFIREFEKVYGDNELPFFEGGYAQAFDTAKRDLKYLLVVLLSPEHDDTDSYNRGTLLNPEVVSFLRNSENNVILWAGNVQDPEAFRVADALKCTKFPFAALICNTPAVSSTAMSVIARITGPMPPSQFLRRLRDAMQAHSEGLNRARRTKAEQQATRDLRDQQNSAYERSLAQDRERARVKREAAEKEQREKDEAHRIEDEARSRAERIERWRRWRASKILPEPGPETKDAVRISLRLLDGERVVRKFPAQAPLEELYAFVDCYEFLRPKNDGARREDDEQETSKEEKVPEKPEDYEHESTFRLVSPMPREAFELKDGGTIGKRIGRSGNLIVERIVADDEDEEEEEVEGIS